ncbi:MAG: YvcK family protein [Syntrophomonadaceae bacterium]|jgi:uncharacterized cofD-like protein|nr:YvcK family protein [Syntrophomonadaceae bacterium]
MGTGGLTPKEWVRERGPRVVAVGGGTGLSVLLRGLKRYTSNLTAVVTVTDDGGSSGRLRGELGVIPPGDIRNCLVALAETETLMDRVFDHRFQAGQGLKGHNLGNLLLVALAEITGDMMSAIKEVSKVLAVRGRVLPSTLKEVVLAAEMRNGVFVTGETAIRNCQEAIKRVFLVPSECKPLVETLTAIAEADVVVLGPGSLYTSIVPNLLVKGVTEALRESTAVKIYVANIMTERGETEDFTLADHLAAIYEHTGEGVIDYIIVNNQPIPAEMLHRYAVEEASPVVIDLDRVAGMKVKVVGEDLLSDSDVAWHDPIKLGRTVFNTISRVEQGARNEFLS